MAGKGSKPGERRGGRKRGTPNKSTVVMREAFMDAFEQMGGVPALVNWGRENPTEFYRIVGRLVPVEHGGIGGGPVRVRWADE